MFTNIAPVGVTRVVRGGSWYHGPDYAASARRFSLPGDSRAQDLGFGPALVPES